MKLAPSYATGFHWYGEFLLNRFSRAEDSLASLHRAAALDPLSPIVQGSLIESLTGAGHFDEAEALLAKLKAAHPDFAAAFDFERNLAVTKGDLVRALRAMKKQAELDPDAVGTASNRCFALMRFGALDDARRCLDAMAAKAGDNDIVKFYREGLAEWTGDFAGADAVLKSMAEPDTGLKGNVWTALGRYPDVLRLYRHTNPELFVDPVGKLSFGQAEDAALVGNALIHTGSPDQGRRLLRAAIQTQSTRPRIMDYSEWDLVEFHVALGESEEAFAELKRGVADGFFIDLPQLDSDAELKDFRKDPRYQQVLAPARAKAAAQVAAARKAGLL
jgi:tetratricopeptide (TPR) repeat protein